MTSHHSKFRSFQTIAGKYVPSTRLDTDRRGCTWLQVQVPLPAPGANPETEGLAEVGGWNLPAMQKCSQTQCQGARGTAPPGQGRTSQASVRRRVSFTLGLIWGYLFAEACKCRGRKWTRGNEPAQKISLRSASCISWRSGFGPLTELVFENVPFFFF